MRWERVKIGLGLPKTGKLHFAATVEMERSTNDWQTTRIGSGGGGSGGGRVVTYGSGGAQR
jgi:hypothetical protein